MGGYNFDLDEDENSLDLAIPAEYDIVPEDLGQIPAPKQSAASSAASSTITPTAPSKGGGFDDEFRKYWMEQAKQGGASATANSKTPTLMSTAPDWYKGGPPPKSNDWAKVLIGTVGGMLSGPAQVAMQDPLRPLGMKMKDAKKIALAQGLEGLFGGLVNKGKSQYDDELDAAKKQSSMNHVASAGTSAGANQANLAARMLALANQDRSITSLEQNRGFNQKQIAAQHDPNSDELAAAKNTLVQKGVASADELEGHTLATLQKAYPILNTMEQEAGRAARDEAKATNDRGSVAVRANAAAELAAEKKRNEDKAREAQAFVDEDLIWRGGAPPDEATQREVRKQVQARGYGLKALDEMKAIQEEMNAMSHGFAGTFDEWMGTLVGTPESKRAQELVTKAQQIQNNLKIQERIRANMGVPQEWEDRLVTSLNPRAGSLQGFLKGLATWDAMKAELDKYTYNAIRTGGAGLKSKGDKAGAGPTYEASQRPVAPIAKVRGKHVVREEPMSDEGGSLPVTTGKVPPIPQQAAASAPKKYKIIPIDGSPAFERPLTPEQVQKALLAKKYKLQEMP